MRRAPTLQIKEYSSPKNTQYADSDGKPVTKSASTITYGPFRNVPRWSDAGFLTNELEEVSVLYEYDAPVTVVKSLKRAAEISHWGSNLNIQDDIWLKNDGAE